MTVLPLDGGRPVTKSIAMCDQGQLGMDNGSRPEGWGLEDLEHAHMELAAIYSRTHFSIDGQNNRLHSKVRVLCTPAWQETHEVCPQVITSDLREEGTNSVPGGHRAWLGFSP